MSFQDIPLPSPPMGDTAEPTGEDAKFVTFYTVAFRGQFAQIPAERREAVLAA